MKVSDKHIDLGIPQDSNHHQKFEERSWRIRCPWDIEERSTQATRKEKTTNVAPRRFVPGRQYRGLRGKVVDWVEHNFEEGLLFIHVRFVDKTELCWRIATRMTIEEGDLSDWKSGDFEQLRVFVRNQRDTGV